MILSSIAMCVASLLLGAFVAYLIMAAENRSDRDEHREAYAEAKIREHNAEAVAQKYVDMKREEHEMLLKFGYVRCEVCGRFTKYGQAYVGYDEKEFYCASCFAKSITGGNSGKL